VICHVPFRDCGTVVGSDRSETATIPQLAVN